MPALTRRTFLAMAAAAGSALAIGACGDDDDSSAGGSADGGDLTGTLNFLNFTGWSAPTTYEDFAAAYPGATVNEIAFVSADDSVAKARDRVGDIDVLLVDGNTFPRLEAVAALGLLGNVPNLSLVADQYKGNPWDPDDTRFAPTDHGRTGIIYRRDLVDVPPTSWREFFDLAPQYANRVAVLDYDRSVMGNILQMLGKPSSSTEQADLDEVRTVLLDLKPNLLAIATEVGPIVAAGDAVMGMADAYDAQLALTTNPDVAWVDPSEGQAGYLEGLAILDGPRNALATAFVDFFLEANHYAAFVNNVATPYVQPDNPGIDEALRTSPVINPPAEVVERLTYHEFLGDAQGAWDEVWSAFQAA